MTNTSFPEVTIRGYIDELAKGNRISIAERALSRFTIIELMQEVSRRIKTGENMKDIKPSERITFSNAQL